MQLFNGSHEGMTASQIAAVMGVEAGAERIIPLTGQILCGERNRTATRQESVRLDGHVIAFDPHPYVRRGVLACGLSFEESAERIRGHIPDSFCVYFSDSEGRWQRLSQASHLTVIAEVGTGAIA
jgi:hypothetical protein